MVQGNDVFGENCGVGLGDLVEEVCGIDGLCVLQWLRFWDWCICGVCVGEFLGCRSKLATQSEQTEVI